jgi:hypothetical protein
MQGDAGKRTRGFSREPWHVSRHRLPQSDGLEHP